MHNGETIGNYTDPIALAYSAANVLLEHEIGHPEQSLVLRGLELQAKQRNFYEAGFRVESIRAFCAPRDFPEAYPPSFAVPVRDLYNVDFKGAFACYQKFNLPQYADISLQALCATFYRVALMPDGQPLPRKYVLNVPITSVTKITAL